MMNDDFVSYWSASRLLASGVDPYDQTALVAMQQSAGWPHDVAIPVWYGPWVLAAMMPIGWLPYGPARIGWLIAQLVCLLAAAVLLWRLYRGSGNARVPLPLIATFAPSLLCLLEGQITPVILLGLAGFLVYERRRADWSAGAALFALTAKPLTLYLLILAVPVWALRAGRPRVLGGLAVTVSLASLAAMAVHPTVFSDWVRFSTMLSPLVLDFTPTLGSILRAQFGYDRLWLAYAPLAIGLAWWIARWRSYRAGLDWTREVPGLAFASLLTAPFAWLHDALLLFPAVVQVAALRWAPGDRAFWFAINASAVGLYGLLRYRQTVYLLYPIAIAVWWAVRGRKGES